MIFEIFITLNLLEFMLRHSKNGKKNKNEGEKTCLESDLNPGQENM